MRHKITARTEHHEITARKGEKHDFKGAKYPEITGYTTPVCTRCGIRMNHPLANESCGVNWSEEKKALVNAYYEEKRRIRELRERERKTR